MRSIRSPHALPLSCCLALVLALALTSSPADARANASSSYQLAQNAQGKEAQAQIKPARAAAIAKKRYGGKVMSIDSRKHDGRVIYRIKLLQEDGRLRNVRVDGRTGKILG